MPIVMMMEWPGVTKAQYEDVRRISNFEGEAPAGAMFHVNAFDEHGMRVVDVWQSAEDFGRFVETRLKPATMKAGLTGDPKVTILPAYNIFAPGYVAK